jgi:tryptophan synthase alpha chain
MSVDTAIALAFARARRQRRAAFIPYITAGDPGLDVTAALLHALADAGADVIEIGVPFSDPIADGPVNQRAAARALAAGTTLSGILGLVAQERARVGVPIVLFTYVNPILARGPERFAEQAAASGVDGILCVDLPPEEAAEIAAPLLERGLDTIFLLAPTSTKERMRLVARTSTGFAYYVSRTGVTGERASLPRELQREVKAVRKSLPVPLAVGFGISTPEQVRAVGRIADGVVVGSALVRLIEQHGRSPQVATVVGELASEMAQALR